ncbi:MAG TPA: hypothetical protein VN801_08630, partial [Candidatus Udaeobacter sp.]|nr:hypothetical protein [Candidatus Udaeobacter sp.]
AGADSAVANHLEKIAVNSFIVIPSEVEESRDAAFGISAGSLDCAEFTLSKRGESNGLRSG